MLKTLKQIANVIAQQSSESKVKSIAMMPVSFATVIGIKTSEAIQDITNISNGCSYKTKNSRKPTK